MKISVEWLKEYADIDVSVKELAERLTMTGSKVETTLEKGNDIKNVVIGKILEINKHPDADKLVVCKVRVGAEGDPMSTLQIITGANNINVGDIVPIAKDGAELPNGVSIKKGQLRGLESNGMMCAVTELGMEVSDFPNQIAEGIMILPSEYEKFIGMDVVEVLNLKEDILDFEITSNRPDCLCAEGLGRETAVALGKPFKGQNLNVVFPPCQRGDVAEGDKGDFTNSQTELDGLTVRIDAPDLCYRYVARIARDVKIAESPEWMKRMLKACGMRPINNIVDITNYVMLELGQPMHAFDINSIEGKQIIVRRAKEDEVITTLDGEDRKLDADTLVIADSKKPVAIAGVMGGMNSEIENGTNTIVFESAVFNGGSVRLSAKRAGLRTEASSRYEKGLPAENSLRVVNRAIELVKELGAGTPVDEVIDVYPTKQEQRKVKLDVDRINSLLGTKISEEEMIKILNNLGIHVGLGTEGDHNSNELTIPYFRQDIENAADIAEEILRIYGYDKLGSTLINAESTIGQRNKKQALEDRIKQLLVDNGYQEMYSYSFLSKKDLEKCNIFEDSSLYKNAVKLKNPLGEDFSIMRPSMMPVVMQSIATNYARKNKNVNLFEIGRTFLDNSHNIEKGELPEEIFNISFASYGTEVDFYSIKNLVQNILEISNISKYNIEKETSDKSMHPGKTANISVGKDVIAAFGEVHPAVTENYGINEKVYFATVDLDKLAKYGKSNKKYSEIPKYPAVERDIAVTIDEDVPVGQIENIITKRCKNTLESLEIFDIYRNEKLGENKKSVAYNLRFRIAERTLTDDEVNGIMETVVSDLERELGAELRK